MVRFFSFVALRPMPVDPSTPLALGADTDLQRAMPAVVPPTGAARRGIRRS